MEAQLPNFEPGFHRFFSWYACRLLRKHFTAVRLSKTSHRFGGLGQEPLVIYLNHPSWWDPMVGLALARHLFPDRRHYAPIDARALERYRFFSRLGFFGIDMGQPAGGTRFLRTAMRITRTPGTVLWITAQGHFTDPRQRPIELQPGLAHLAHRMTAGWIVPLALDYPFWDQKLPEVLIRFGEPIAPAELGTMNINDANQLLATRLEQSQDSLLLETMTRKPELFEPLLSGTVGTHKLYDAWGWLKAKLQGRTFTREHQVIQ